MVLYITSVTNVAKWQERSLMKGSKKTRQSRNRMKKFVVDVRVYTTSKILWVKMEKRIFSALIVGIKMLGDRRQRNGLIGKKLITLN